MSRVGKLPIDLAEGVKVEVSSRTVSVVGPKGTLSRGLPRGIEVEVKNKKVFVTSLGKSQNLKALHGTHRALIANMAEGVANGWKKTLELVGAGYRAEVVDEALVLTVGYSHPVKIDTPEGVTFKVEKNVITVEGVDKELVGKVADKVRRVRPPEPYKGKGIKYQDEVIKRKPGKAAKAQGAAAAQ